MLPQKFKKEEWWIILTLIICLMTVIFAKAADNYLDWEGWVLVDSPINKWIVNNRSPELNRLMLLITLTGNWQMIIWGSVLGAILLLAAHKERYLKVMLVSNSIGVLFTEAIKAVVSRPRPPAETALITENGFAFPSGHSYFAVVFYGLIVYFWYRHFRKRLTKVLVMGAGVIFVLLLAISRIYLGVHWTTDVIAGLSASTGWLMLTILYVEYKNKYSEKIIKEFDRKQVWEGVWVAALLWLSGLVLFYLQAVNIYQL